MGDNVPLCLMLAGIRMDSLKESEQKRREEFNEKNGLRGSIKREKSRETIHFARTQDTGRTVAKDKTGEMEITQHRGLESQTQMHILCGRTSPFKRFWQEI